MAKRRRILSSAKSDTSYQRQRVRQRGKRRAWLIGLGVLGVVILAGGALLLTRPASTLPQEVSAVRAFEEHQNGALVLDVRTQAEWDQGHIADSLLIPLDELSNRLSELPRDRNIVVVCRSGVRSKEGASILRAAGFTRVTCLSGGLESWIAQGYPLGN